MNLVLAGGDRVVVGGRVAALEVPVASVNAPDQRPPHISRPGSRCPHRPTLVSRAMWATKNTAGTMPPRGPYHPEAVLGFIGLVLRCFGCRCIEGQALRCHSGVAPVSLRCHSGVTPVSLRWHSGVTTPMSLRCRSVVAPARHKISPSCPSCVSLHNYHAHKAATPNVALKMSPRWQSDVTPMALRWHSDVTPISLRCHSDVTPMSLRCRSAAPTGFRYTKPETPIKQPHKVRPPRRPRSRPARRLPALRGRLPWGRRSSPSRTGPWWSVQMGTRWNRWGLGGPHGMGAN